MNNKRLKIREIIEKAKDQGLESLPSTIEKSIENFRKESFSRKRCVYLTGEVNESSAENIMSELFKLEMSDPSGDIIIVINSYGGYVHSAWSIIDTMNMLRCNVHTLSIGQASSAGAVILLSGTKGKRYAAPHASIMLHKISSETRGHIDDMDIDVKETKRLQEQLENHIISRTKIKSKQLSEMLSRNRYLTPEEAVQFGLIDKIISSFGDIKMKGW
jgi:ATP-dependent Clp protease protease subunit